MKAKEIQELHNLSEQELNVKLAELKEELFNLRFRHATGQLENPVSLRNCKRDIARVQTILRQKELKA
ncbi:MAG: 50S ribosomal protein L29 [Clostridia bacterium]|jgi:large subunit ribosomal protein L29|nr:50S ribosomal protein L29 [Clostridia bacterium]